VIELVGRQVKIVVDEARLRPEKSEVMRLQSDNSKARELLGWEPKVGFHAGLEKTIRWISEHMDLYRVGIYES
jgi:dTDP-glucose 4,6-dehydratase